MLIKTPVYNEIEEFIKSDDNYCILNHTTYKEEEEIVCSAIFKGITDNGQILLYSKPAGNNRNVTFKTQDLSFVGLKLLCTLDSEFNYVFKPLGKYQLPDILKDSIYENYTLVVGYPGVIIKNDINHIVSENVNSHKEELYNLYPNKILKEINIREAVKVIKDLGYVTNLKYEYTNGLDDFPSYNLDIDFALSCLRDPAKLFDVSEEIFTKIKPSCVYWLSRADCLNNIIRDINEDKEKYKEIRSEIEKHYSIKNILEKLDTAKTVTVITKDNKQYKVLKFIQNNINSGSCFRVVKSNIEININDIIAILYKDKPIYQENI